MGEASIIRRGGTVKRGSVSTISNNYRTITDPALANVKNAIIYLTKDGIAYHPLGTQYFVTNIVIQDGVKRCVGIWSSDESTKLLGVSYDNEAGSFTLTGTLVEYFLYKSDGTPAYDYIIFD